MERHLGERAALRGGAGWFTLNAKMWVIMIGLM